MNVFNRLVIGTANWGQPYGHRHVFCPRAEQEKIIEYAHCNGITDIDTATAYNVDLSWVPTAFDIHMKIGEGEQLPRSMKHSMEYYVWAHNEAAYWWLRNEYGLVPYGVSLYEPSPGIPDTSSVQIQYSPFNRRWEQILNHMHDLNETIAARQYIFVRSVFTQGKVFTSDEPPFVRFRQYAHQLNMPVGTLCILFCLLNPAVDKVIIGVDSLEQLKENLRFFHRLNSFQVDDVNMIDPRKWMTNE